MIFAIIVFFCSAKSIAMEWQQRPVSSNTEQKLLQDVRTYNQFDIISARDLPCTIANKNLMGRNFYYFDPEHCNNLSRQRLDLDAFTQAFSYPLQLTVPQYYEKFYHALNNENDPYSWPYLQYLASEPFFSSQAMYSLGRLVRHSDLYCAMYGLNDEEIRSTIAQRYFISSLNGNIAHYPPAVCQLYNTCNINQRDRDVALRHLFLAAQTWQINYPEANADSNTITYTPYYFIHIPAVMRVFGLLNEQISDAQSVKQSQSVGQIKHLIAIAQDALAYGNFEREKDRVQLTNKLSVLHQSLNNESLALCWQDCCRRLAENEQMKELQDIALGNDKKYINGILMDQRSVAAYFVETVYKYNALTRCIDIIKYFFQRQEISLAVHWLLIIKDQIKYDSEKDFFKHMVQLMDQYLFNRPNHSETEKYKGLCMTLKREWSGQVAGEETSSTDMQALVLQKASDTKEELKSVNFVIAEPDFNSNGVHANTDQQKLDWRIMYADNLDGLYKYMTGAMRNDQSDLVDQIVEHLCNHNYRCASAKLVECYIGRNQLDNALECFKGLTKGSINNKTDKKTDKLISPNTLMGLMYKHNESINNKSESLASLLACYCSLHLEKQSIDVFKNYIDCLQEIIMCAVQSHVWDKDLQSTITMCLARCIKEPVKKFIEIIKSTQDNHDAWKEYITFLAKKHTCFSDNDFLPNLIDLINNCHQPDDKIMLIRSLLQHNPNGFENGIKILELLAEKDNLDAINLLFEQYIQQGNITQANYLLQAKKRVMSDEGYREKQVVLQQKTHKQPDMINKLMTDLQDLRCSTEHKPLRIGWIQSLYALLDPKKYSGYADEFFERLLHNKKNVNQFVRILLTEYGHFPVIKILNFLDNSIIHALDMDEVTRQSLLISVRSNILLHTLTNFSEQKVNFACYALKELYESKELPTYYPIIDFCGCFTPTDVLDTYVTKSFQQAVDYRDMQAIHAHAHQRAQDSAWRDLLHEDDVQAAKQFLEKSLQETTTIEERIRCLESLSYFSKDDDQRIKDLCNQLQLQLERLNPTLDQVKYLKGICCSIKGELTQALHFFKALHSKKAMGRTILIKLKNIFGTFTNTEKHKRPEFNGNFKNDLESFLKSFTHDQYFQRHVSNKKEDCELTDIHRAVLVSCEALANNYQSIDAGYVLFNYWFDLYSRDNAEHNLKKLLFCFARMHRDVSNLTKKEHAILYDAYAKFSDLADNIAVKYAIGVIMVKGFKANGTKFWTIRKNITNELYLQKAITLLEDVYKKKNEEENPNRYDLEGILSVIYDAQVMLAKSKFLNSNDHRDDFIPTMSNMLHKYPQNSELYIFLYGMYLTDSDDNYRDEIIALLESCENLPHEGLYSLAQMRALKNQKDNAIRPLIEEAVRLGSSKALLMQCEGYLMGDYGYEVNLKKSEEISNRLCDKDYYEGYVLKSAAKLFQKDWEGSLELMRKAIADKDTRVKNVLDRMPLIRIVADLHRGLLALNLQLGQEETHNFSMQFTNSLYHFLNISAGLPISFMKFARPIDSLINSSDITQLEQKDGLLVYGFTLYHLFCLASAIKEQSGENRKQFEDKDYFQGYIQQKRALVQLCLKILKNKVRFQDEADKFLLQERSCNLHFQLLDNNISQKNMLKAIGDFLELLHKHISLPGFIKEGEMADVYLNYVYRHALVRLEAIKKVIVPTDELFLQKQSNIVLVENDLINLLGSVLLQKNIFVAAKSQI